MRQHLVLVRHGTTDAIENSLMQGSSNSPLSSRGLEEARRTAKALAQIRFGSIFSSPMGRALQTAEILAAAHPDLKVIPLADLREMDFGFYEQKRYFASPQEEPAGLRRMVLMGKVLVAQVSGELLCCVHRRAARCWRKIRAAAPPGSILVVSHGVLLNYLLKNLLSKKAFKSARPLGMHPCGITELEISAGQTRILRLDDTSHLQ